MELAFPDRLASQFKLSDILGYLAPGAGFLVGIYGFERWAAHVIGAGRVHLPFSTAFGLVLGSDKAKEEWFVYLSVAAVALLVIYITGHIIESVAVLFLDRLLIYKAYGYPYQGLLLVGPEHAPKDRTALPPESQTFSRAYYRGMFFWTNTYLALRSLCFVVRALPAAAWVQSTLLWSSRVLGAFIVVAFFFKIIIVPIRRRHQERERARRARAAAAAASAAASAGEQSAPPQDDEPDTPPSEPRFMSWLIRVLTRVLAGPWELLVGKPLSNLINSRRSFDLEFREMYALLFQKTFGLNPRTTESNNYWMSYSYVVTHSSKLAAVAAHWEMMSTFSRNLGAAFYLAFIYCLCWLQLEGPRLPYAVEGAAILAALPVFLLLLSASLLLNHYYLYVSYYSKFLYRAFVYLAHTHQSRPDIKLG